MDVNLNNAQCMVTKTHWGYDQIINICSKTLSTVDWTGFDYFGAIFLISIGIGIVAMLASMVYVVLFD